MDNETYEALKRIMRHATYGGANDTAFWDDIKQVEGWIDETAKEHNGYCEVCGEKLNYDESGNPLGMCPNRVREGMRFIVGIR